MVTSRLLLILLLCIGAAAGAVACKCGRDPDAPPEGSTAAVAVDLENADAVFTATVIGRQSWARLLLRVPRYLFLTRGERELTDEEEDRLFRRKVWLRVEEPFKGAEPGRTVLFTGWGVGDCGYRFRRGDRYLVYAGAWDDGLYTGICYPTKPLDEASELPILRRLVVREPVYSRRSSRRGRTEDGGPSGTSTHSMSNEPR